ncbi:MAG: S9 family peptidase [Deltaproteobacteria bacterium]|nr:MAG: S9 family peptidase [Deltaproteobacteria bacterium]
MATTAPYGSWSSPITSELISSGAVRLGPVTLVGDDLYSLESRPTEGGRYVLVRRPATGPAEDVTPRDMNVRTRVHEYGGASYLVAGDAIFFSNFVDQRLYRQDRGGPARAITPEPEVPAGLRYADPQLTPDGRTLVCIRERHTADGQVINELVALPADGSGAPRILTGGHDFYAYPRISPDGRSLVWTQWDHPNMPWDGVELCIAERASDGTLSRIRTLAGGRDESIFQPAWSPHGILHFASDRTGWWNLYRVDGGAQVALAPMAAELGAPQWGLDAVRYAFLGDGTIACIYTQDGIDHLGIIAPGATAIREIATPFTGFAGLDGGQRDIAVTAGGPTTVASVARIAVPGGKVTIVQRSIEADLDPGYLSPARAIEFPTSGGRTAHALYYAPNNRDFQAPPGERPPLLVVSHGGPTAAAGSALNLGFQFWTSRGVAVVDVNYGGSTGYGRAYRERLKGTWGITDVDDCVNAARHLSDQGLVDPARLAIRGGSAGGYTTLAALTFRDVFAAGASYYGVADLEGLAKETHKFESRYLDGLIGPYPEARDRYLERSPVHHTDRLSTPMIIFQGLEDKVVPPSQAEAMVAALERKRVPHAYLPFEGEQHGFRRAENIKRSLDAELSFYGQILGFAPADPIAPVPIKHARPR